MTCCGQPMKNEHGILVCGRCGAWYDPGTTTHQTTRHHTGGH